MTNDYPSLAWIKRELRNNISARYRGTILDGFIVGSEAKGTARPDSDLDVAIIIPNRRHLTSLQVSERWHMRQTWPIRWKDRKVDIQFFYADDPELSSYSRIPLSKNTKRRSLRAKNTQC
ncbi:nucleotidyltransferase domain-containing protein [Edaphobacter dinghuensis]